MFLKKSDKKVYFFAQKFAYIVDFLYLCSVIGKYTLFIYVHEGAFAPITSIECAQGV